MSVRCSRCILPGTIPHISFDENGVCNYCREYDENKSKIDINYGLKGEKFRGFVDEAIRERVQNGSKYDALVPVSGGRDSSYLAWELSKRLKRDQSSPQWGAAAGRGSVAPRLSAMHRRAARSGKRCGATAPVQRRARNRMV